MTSPTPRIARKARQNHHRAAIFDESWLGYALPLLHRLAGQGLIESYGGTSPNGRARKYYRLLPAGNRQLETHHKSFDLIGSTLSKLQQLGGGNAYATA